MSDLTLRFQSKPVTKAQAKVISDQTVPARYIPFTPETTYLHIHQRLMKVLNSAPTVAVYPWLIDLIDSSSISTRRNHRLRVDDQKFATSASSFLNWPLDNRRIRLGLVTTFSGAGNSHRSHVWVIGIVKSATHRGGVLVFIFDDAGTAAINTFRDGGSFLTPAYMLAGQRNLLSKLKKLNFNIKYLFFGGRPLGGEGEKCLESSVRFMEDFTSDMAGSSFQLDMLRKVGMEQIPLRST